MNRRIAMVLGAALAAVALGAPPASADPDSPPDFKLPFLCGQSWTLTTYEGHGNDNNDEGDNKQIDFFRADGDTEGSDVLASAAGKVVWSGDGVGGINIDHGNGWFSQYLHMSERVAEGTVLEEGDWVGTASNVGTGVAHLHYQQMYDFDEDGAGEEDELVHPTLQGTTYEIDPDDEFPTLVSENACDGGDPGEPDPEPLDTTLEYTGATSIAGGSAAALSAVLEDENGEPVDGRVVDFSLGEGDAAQTCEGTTDAEGSASCTVEEVDQALTDDGTIPVTAAFAGDDEYNASDVEEQVKLQYVSGRAYGLSATVPLLTLPVAIDPTPDTGDVRTAGATTKAPACAQGISAVVLSADVLCAEVKTETGPSGVTSTSTVSKATVGLTGLPVIKVSGLTATSQSSCTAKEGATELTLSIAGTAVEVPDTPNHTIDLAGGAKIVTNEQTETDDGLTVNALHLTGLDGIDVVLGSSTSAAHNCV